MSLTQRRLIQQRVWYQYTAHSTGTSPTRRSDIVLNVHDMREVPGHRIGRQATEDGRTNIQKESRQVCCLLVSMLLSLFRCRHRTRSKSHTVNQFDVYRAKTLDDERQTSQPFWHWQIWNFLSYKGIQDWR